MHVATVASPDRRPLDSASPPKILGAAARNLHVQLLSTQDRETVDPNHIFDQRRIAQQ